MILKSRLWFVLLLTYTSFFGQNKEIEILETKSTESVIISIKNNTKEAKEISLTIKGTGFEKIISPVVKTVESNDLIIFCELKPIKNKQFNYNLSYSYISKPKVKNFDNPSTQKQLANKNIVPSNDNTSKISLTENDDLSKGIYVFAKDGCPRCGLTLKYLEENKINYKVFYISKNKEAKELMWTKLTEINFSGKLTMPVVIVNGKLSYSHKDLPGFLKTLSN